MPALAYVVAAQGEVVLERGVKEPGDTQVFVGRLCKHGLEGLS
jgi:hypothetical protein